MKRMRKLISFMLTMVMVFAMSATAFAANTYTITIKNSAEGHTYEAYQIFKGDLSEDETTLSNIEWGSGINAEGKTALGTASERAAELEGKGFDADETKAFAQEVEAYLTSPAGTTSTSTDGKYVISGLEAGYYLVKDANDTLDGTDDSYTRYILAVVDDVEVTTKSGKPESYKKVKDVNDTDGIVTEWQDSADYDVNDRVPFQLTGKVAANYDDYKVYKFVFHDKEAEGLTFDAKSVKVFVDGTEITSGYTVVTEGLEDECTFEIRFDNLKDIKEVKAGSVITVEYESVLNDKAALGEAGNPNVMYLEYSNNPNDETGAETGETPEDKVIVFTYKVIVNKTDKDNNPLPGAGFTLYKKNSEGAYVAVGEELTGDALTTFEWSGLDDGEYKLEETTTPDGYNTIDAIEFTISATHDTESADPKLTALDGGELFSGNFSTGALTTSVVNEKGTVLPSTGGFGTTAFYFIGTILMMGAAVTLITRRRMNHN